MRLQRRVLTRHTTPTNASDVVHKSVFQLGGVKKPSAKTNQGTHQKRQALGPLHSKSRSGPLELASADCISVNELTTL
jgi:IS5 family transposase